MSEEQITDVAVVSHETREPQPPALVEPVFSVEQYIAARQKINQIATNALKQGYDYGTIPGAKKQVLLKPGAEKFCTFFNLKPRFSVVEKEIDHNAKNEYPEKQWDNRTRRKVDTGRMQISMGSYRYVVKCELVSPDGTVQGDCVASCSSYESKYIDRPRDLENTILKMAQKRALVGAVLLVADLSEIFDQDLDEFPNVKMAPPAPAKTTTSAAPGVTGFDPSSNSHLDHLAKDLEKRKIPKDKWDDIAVAMKGKSSADLDSVISGVL